MPGSSIWRPGTDSTLRPWRGKRGTRPPSSQDVAGSRRRSWDSSLGLPASFESDPRLPKLDAIVNRVEKVNAEIRPRVEAAHEAVEVRPP